jgi:hypothetical protein
MFHSAPVLARSLTTNPEVPHPGRSVVRCKPSAFVMPPGLAYAGIVRKSLASNPRSLGPQSQPRGRPENQVIHGVRRLKQIRASESCWHVIPRVGIGGRGSSCSNQSVKGFRILRNPWMSLYLRSSVLVGAAKAKACCALGANQLPSMVKTVVSSSPSPYQARMAASRLPR